MKINKTDLHTTAGIGDAAWKEASLDVSLGFRVALSQVLSKCRDSRYQLAGRLSELTGRDISKSSLDKYCSSDLTWGLRAEDLPATVVATGSLEHVQVLLAPIGCSVATAQDNKLLKLARLTQDRKKLDTEIAHLEMELVEKKGGK
jgi:hypothetical protein